MMKRMLILLTAILTAAIFCGTGTAADTLQLYENLEGWAVRYDPAQVEVSEDGDTVTFSCPGSGDASGSLQIRFVPGGQPEEVLYELTSSWGNETEPERSEGFFPGTDDRWGYWRSLAGTPEDPDTERSAFAGEYDGGVLQFLFTVHKSGNEEEDMAVSDVLSSVTDSITYAYFEEQSMYAYYPGVYETDADGPVRSVVLLHSHHGTICGEEDRSVIWGSSLLTDEEDPGQSCEFSIEGENLYLRQGEEWLSFTKQKLPAYVYPGPDKLRAAVCDGILTETGRYFEAEDVAVPCPVIVGTDESNPEDILVWGDFWVFNYDRDGDTLLEKSGGSFPGLIHLRKEGDSFAFVRMEEVSSGADYEQSARSIFGNRFEDLEKAHSDADAREELLGRTLADYAAANNLSLAGYQAYGWDPVPLPEAGNAG